MSPGPSVFTSFRPNTEDMEPIAEGDCLLILRRSGAVQVINAGYDRNRLTLPEDQMTEEDRFMARQGEKLFALALAASNEELMDWLLSVSRDPDVIDYDQLRRMTRLN